MESGLRLENSRLAKELEEAQMDLDDARIRRRELQLQVNAAEKLAGQFGLDCASMMV